MKQVIEIVQEALKGNRKLRIRGYRSSTGDVADREVEMIGSAGYRRLVEQSLDGLDALIIDPQIGVPSAWEVAKDEQRASWQRTLTNPPATPLSDLIVSSVAMDGTPSSIKLEHLRSLTPVETPDVTSCRTPITAAKKLIQAASPIGTYIGAMSLSEGKFQSVELIPDEKPVTWADYQQLALRTESPCEGVQANLNRNYESKIRLLHAALGLASEIHEFTESDDRVNNLAETGDMFWFVAIGLKGLGADFQSPAVYEELAKTSGPSSVINALFHAIGRFVDHVKAVAFYDRQVFEVVPTGKLAARTQLEADLHEVTTALFRLCTLVLHVEPTLIIASNIAKLRKRYPDRYTQEAALNRNTQREDAAIAATAAV